MNVKKIVPYLIVPLVVVIVLLSLAVAIGPAAADDHLPPAGPPSGNGVQPVVKPGNPDCSALGYGFGFKMNGSTNGTYTLTNPPGELTGGATPDPNNSITISNSDGLFFDWSATLGIDAIIVKGGPNANLYAYDPEETSDTDLHAPFGAAGGTQPHSISHIEFCYDYEVDVSKTAETSFTRTFDWTIDKSVTPETWDLFTGDSGTSKYTVSVTKDDGTDSDWEVSGTITIENNTPFNATIEDVSDEVSGVGAVSVICNEPLPHILASGGTLTCTYSTTLPDGSDRTNTATVTTSGDVGGGEDTADVTFGDPTTLVNDSINVNDSYAGDLGTFNDSGSIDYDRTFTCDGDEGTHDNTATIVETGQSDDASVTVNCYELTVTKNASTSFTRTWSWTIDKSADQTDLLLADGQLFQVNYEVTVNASAVDSNHAVSGDIWIANANPSRDATLTSVSDVVSPAIAADVTCPSLTVPAGDSLHCTYSADLPNADNRTNTATASLQNFDYDAEGIGTPSGTTDFSGNADVDFSGATVEEVDECVDVSDTNVGDLGTVCAGDAPGTSNYSLWFGKHPDADVLLECGDNSHTNTASFVTNDTSTTGEDDWTVNANVTCAEGCTLTQGYWKTHSEFGPAPYDDTWAELANGASTPFFLSGKTNYQVLWTAPAGNAYYNLAHQYIAAQLNQLNGASIPADELDAFNEATGLFNTYTPAQIAALKGNNPLRKQFIALAGILDAYNNGVTGPGHCSE